jgi:hypothetical protein
MICGLMKILTELAAIFVLHFLKKSLRRARVSLGFGRLICDIAGAASDPLLGAENDSNDARI